MPSHLVELRGIEPLTPSMPWAGPNARKCSYTSQGATGASWTPLVISRAELSLVERFTFSIQAY